MIKSSAFNFNYKIVKHIILSIFCNESDKLGINLTIIDVRLVIYPLKSTSTFYKFTNETYALITGIT